MRQETKEFRTGNGDNLRFGTGAVNFNTKQENKIAARNPDSYLAIASQHRTYVFLKAQVGDWAASSLRDERSLRCLSR